MAAPEDNAAAASRADRSADTRLLLCIAIGQTIGWGTLFSTFALFGAPMEAELGWSPRFQDFEAGLADTITWYQEHEDWWRPHKQATEAFYATKGQ